MAERGMISADSHVIEPRNLWVERVDKQFRDRAPRVMRNPNGLKGEWFICEGLEPRPASLAFAAGKDPSEYSEFQKATNYDDALPGGWEAAIDYDDAAKVAKHVAFNMSGVGSAYPTNSFANG